MKDSQKAIDGQYKNESFPNAPEKRGKQGEEV